MDHDDASVRSDVRGEAPGTAGDLSSLDARGEISRLLTWAAYPRGSTARTLFFAKLAQNAVFASFPCGAMGGAEVRPGGNLAGIAEL